MNSPQGRYMKSKHQSTVEPVFDTLTQFMGMRKINTIGLEQANKVMHLSAMAYNLKKYLKFEQKRSNSGLGQLSFKAFIESVVQYLFLGLPSHQKFTVQY
ncbi:transposase [Maribacter arcticus]|uniref:transposase n=1 Tax=Maribacter arcticus TaxID=561365 RepID=UPI001F48CA1F|nr:transposase [Maribacter arcticus]